MKYLFTLGLILCLIYSATAQKKPVLVSGKVIHSDTQEPLEFATISLKDVVNPDFLTGGITNADGSFSIEVPPSNYHIKIEYLSFQTTEMKDKAILENTNLGTIKLTMNPALLDELEVVAEKTKVEFHLDKKVFNVGKDLISKGGSISDVLENVPSVTVDADGAINLRGNSNVRILINGKPSVMTRDNGLAQIPANAIEKVEVITNPSARYEAQGSAGIINIILKKNSLEGLSGSLQLRAGSPEDTRPSLSLNYKAKKLNLFSTIGYRRSTYLGRQISQQQTNNAGLISNLYQITEQDRSDRTANVYLGADYTINEHNTLTASVYHRNHLNVDYSETFYDFSDADYNLDNTIQRIENYREPQIYNQWELNYTRTFNTKGQKLTAVVQYDFWNDDEHERIGNQTTFPAIEEIQQIESRDVESSKDLLLQLDFVKPLPKNKRLELGFRGETRVITSDYYAQTAVGETWEILNGIDNELDYYERIGGAYVQYGKKSEKWNYLVGLRAEYTSIRIAEETATQDIEKRYPALFPTLNINYNINEDRSVQLSYSRRIQRPRFWQLNPFGGISDFRNLFGGNPDLDPSYTNSFELGILTHGDKLTINPSVYYQLTTDYFYGITQQLENDIFFRMPTNQPRETRWGLELSTTYHPLKWWTVTGNFNFFQVIQEGQFNELNLDNTNNTWFARINSRMKLPQQISLQATFNYQGKNVNVQTTREAVYHADIALSKDLLNDKASLTLGVRNLLDSRNFRWITTGDTFWQDSERTPFGRRWSATFVYRFNQKKGQRERRPGGSNRQ